VPAWTLNHPSILRCQKANTVSYLHAGPDGGGEGQGFGVGSIHCCAPGRCDAERRGWHDDVHFVGTTSWPPCRHWWRSKAVAQLDVNVAIARPRLDYNLNSSDHPDHRTTGDLTRAASVGRA